MKPLTKKTLIEKQLNQRMEDKEPKMKKNPVAKHPGVAWPVLAVCTSDSQNTLSAG